MNDEACQGQLPGEQGWMWSSAGRDGVGGPHLLCPVCGP